MIRIDTRDILHWSFPPVRSILVAIRTIFIINNAFRFLVFPSWALVDIGRISVILVVFASLWVVACVAMLWVLTAVAVYQLLEKVCAHRVSGFRQSYTGTWGRSGVLIAYIEAKWLLVLSKSRSGVRVDWKTELLLRMVGDGPFVSSHKPHFIGDPDMMWNQDKMEFWGNTLPYVERANRCYIGVSRKWRDVCDLVDVMLIPERRVQSMFSPPLSWRNDHEADHWRSETVNIQAENGFRIFRLLRSQSRSQHSWI